MSIETAPKMPRAQTTYGAIVYWITILSALICMVGPVISVASPENNILNPYKLFNAIFEGKDAQTVWQEVGGEFPGGHFYFKYFTYGDGFTQFVLALWVSALVALSMIGIVGMH